TQDATVLVFLPTVVEHPLQVHAGASVHLSIGSFSQNSTIDHVEPGILSPTDVQKRYGFAYKVPQLVTGPSTVASIKPGSSFFSRSYDGSVVSVQVQVATTNVLSLLLNTATFNGD
ncbi:MAG TPA: hypothetical protein VH593_22430, partial [Ktedonobacteraceae bacterium]